jgi:hypothetical protein
MRRLWWLGVVLLVGVAACKPKRAPAPEEPATPAPAGKTVAQPQTAGGLMPNSAQAQTSRNNLQQLALAMLNGHATDNALPGNIVSPTGQPLLSWRVALLPYLEQMPLYQLFKLDEPWDSSHNKQYVKALPKILTNPARPAAEGHTHYQVIAGPASLFPLSGLQRPTLARLTDGAANTLLIAEAADAVEWTKPSDLVYNPGGPLPKFAAFYQGAFLAALADGSVKTILPSKVGEKNLRAALTPAGGEVMGSEW